jgi:hypothetical protein
MVETYVSSSLLFENLHCLMCSGYLTAPVMLIPCQHSFCIHCAKELKVRCEICGGRIEKLIRNEKLGDIVDRIYREYYRDNWFTIRLEPARREETAVHLSYCKNVSFGEILEELCRRKRLEGDRVRISYYGEQVGNHELLSNYMGEGDSDVTFNYEILDH